MGTNLIYKDQTIQLESIRSQVSILSMINNQFALTDLIISSKSIPIKNLISLIRSVKNDPKLLIAEQFIENGFIIELTKLNCIFPPQRSGHNPKWSWHERFMIVFLCLKKVIIQTVRMDRSERGACQV